MECKGHDVLDQHKVFAVVVCQLGEGLHAIGGHQRREDEGPREPNREADIEALAVEEPNLLPMN